MFRRNGDFNCWSSGLLAMALTLGTLNAHAQATAGVDAIKLQVMALDTSVNCNRTFYRSSQQFQNTVFMTPRVYASPGNLAKGAPYMIKPNPQKKGEYLLDVYLYFPRNGQKFTSANTAASSREQDYDNCRVDRVKNAINSLITDGTQKIEVVAFLPLTSITLELNGIRGKARALNYSIDTSNSSGQNQVDNIPYINSTLTATFEISAEEREYFLSQIVSPVGLEGAVTMSFQGRRADGSLKASVNASDIQAKFQAAAAGKIKITKANAKIGLQGAITRSALNITAERSSNEATNKAIEDKIAQLLSEMSTKIDKMPVEAPIGDAAQEDGVINVSAVLGVIAQFDKREINVNYLGVPETATSREPIHIQVGSIASDESVRVEVQGDYGPVSPGYQLKAGETLAITLANWRIEEIDYNTNVDEYFLTPEDLNDLNLGFKFKPLQDDKFVVRSQVTNGTVWARGHHSIFKWGSAFYKWRRKSYFPNRVQIKSENYEFKTTEALEKTIENLEVAISFSRVASGAYRYNLASLLASSKDGQKNDWWEVTADANTKMIWITAKRDLGLVQFHELMRDSGNPNDFQGVEKKKIVTDEVVMERYGDFFVASVLDSQTGVTLATDNNAITKQKTIVLYVQRPFRLDSGASLSPTISPHSAAGTRSAVESYSAPLNSFGGGAAPPRPTAPLN